MRSKVKKALCCTAAVAVTAGLAAMTACTYYSADALEGDYSYTSVVSNGGFAVEAGNYIYFINGSESNTADNTYGDVEKGAIVRISVEDYNNCNYKNVDTVVPLVTYSGNYDSGIYVYGDYIYYSTPSTNRDSSGEILNDQLEFKRTKLDGTETMKDCYVNIDNSSVEYRYVYDEDSDTVYLLYVVSENIFDDVSYSAYNIHSLNLTTREDTILAYDVDEYVFDTSDLESPWIYYTMEVTYNLGTGYDGETTDYSTTADYNQVYRVCAYETDDYKWAAEDKYDFSYVVDADGEACYDYDANPLYINRGEMVYDGIGAFSGLTQFNYEWDSANDAADTIISGSDLAASLSGYNYSLVGLQDGNLYYTRSYYDSSSSSTAILFYVTEDEIDEGMASTDGWNAVEENIQVLNGTEVTASNPTPAATLDDHTLILYATDVSGYTIYTGENNSTPSYVMSVDSATSGYAIMWASLEDGQVSADKESNFPMTTTSSSVTYLTTSTETVDGTEYTFLYYSVDEEGNSYSVHRIALYGTYDDYVKYPVYQDYDGDDAGTIAKRAAESNYYDVQILNLDCAAWYMPEIIEGQFMFASATDDMTDYNYIMVCDLRESTSTTSTISNYDISELNDLYDDVIETIDDTDDDDYENLANALYYVFYTRDSEYLAELVGLWVDEGEDVQYLYSNESQQMYLDFYNAENDYADYNNNSKTVNGDTVYATSRDYFYSLIGYMSEDDEEAYTDSMRDTYMQAEPEDESWWDGLETWVKVIFIVGVSLGGLLIIAAAVLIPIFVVRKKHKKMPSYNKNRVKVDTTDDKDIDVYGIDEDADGASDTKPADDSSEE